MNITHLKCCSAVDDIAIIFDTFGSSLQWLSLFEKRDRTQYECHFEERQANSDVDGKITDKGMIRIIESCPNLKHLYMDLKSKRITDNISLSLAKFCTNLQSLEMSNCLYITDMGLINIAEGCRSIQTLNLSNCSRIGYIGVKRIAECSPNLRVLDLTYCWEINNNCIIRIVENCPNLETLILSDCKRITDISSIPISCPNLQSLDLSKCRRITANCLINISECHNLRILDVSEMFLVTDTIVMRILEGCSKLESLTMHDCISMSYHSKMKIAKRYPNLKFSSKWENIAANNENNQMMFAYFEGDYGDH
jgi:Leucine-rich repeat (LRR) protein